MYASGTYFPIPFKYFFRACLSPYFPINLVICLHFSFIYHTQKHTLYMARVFGVPTELSRRFAYVIRDAAVRRKTPPTQNAESFLQLPRQTTPPFLRGTESYRLKYTNAIVMEKYGSQLADKYTLGLRWGGVSATDAIGFGLQANGIKSFVRKQRKGGLSRFYFN